MTDAFSDLTLSGEQAVVDDRSAEAELNAESLLHHLVEIVNSAKAMPLSASVLVSREEVLEVLNDIMDRLPDELRQARWLLREREEFLAERTKEAAALMEDVRAQAERLIARTEIVRQAKQTARKITDDANEDARRMRHEAEDYCDQKLAGMEIVLERIMRTVHAGREKLQATAPPAADPQATAPAAPLGEGESTEDGFFDQDIS